MGGKRRTACELNPLAGYNGAVATYLKHEDAYEWQLDLPPHAVMALLQAVCVDVTAEDGKIRQIQHLLWGPKSWGVSVQGFSFVLVPLDRRTWQRMFGNHHGTIDGDKAGSRVRVCFTSDPAERRKIHMLVSIVVSLIGVVGVTVAALNQLWIGVAGVLAACGWFAFALGWLMPAYARSEPVSFLDQVFANHCFPADNFQSKQRPQKLAS